MSGRDYLAGQDDIDRNAVRQGVIRRMKRVMLTVAYDGSAYSGWRVQPNADTIEGQLNKHLSELLGEEITVIGASRTDAGVHALCNLAVFSTNARIPAEKISYALNQRLPQDIRIQKSEEVAEDFHPRKVETRKTYEYCIYHAKFANPILEKYSYFVYVPLDLKKMKQAAEILVGTHDFAGFSTYKPEVTNTIRTITNIQILTEHPWDKQDCELIRIRVTGNGFLYNMVRIIVGTLVAIGRGQMDIACIAHVLETGNRELAGPTAPAQGLMLMQYEIME